MAICPHCGREIREMGAAFCPFCGGVLSDGQAAETPAGALVLLDQMARQRSNKKKLALLYKAREQYPDCLAVEEEVLFQGKLPEKAGFTLDYGGIKSYLLEIYLHPEHIPAQQQAAMRQELFHDAQLERCLALAPSREGYLAHYLERLSSEYIDIFLMGSNEYMPRLMGFQLERRPEKALAKPVARMLRAMQADENLTGEERSQLAAAFEKAFAAQCGGNLMYLQKALQES